MLIIGPVLIAGKMEVFIKPIGYYREEAYKAHDVNRYQNIMGKLFIYFVHTVLGSL